jgi:hypothetical protein
MFQKQHDWQLFVAKSYTTSATSDEAAATGDDKKLTRFLP